MRKEYERIGFTEIFLIRHFRLRMWWESEDSIHPVEQPLEGRALESRAAHEEGVPTHKNG